MPYKNKEKQREYQRKWVAKRHAHYLEGRVCEKCGTIEKLQFHHLNREDKVSHRIWSWSHARIKKELEKCELLCIKCHGIQHRKNKHGGMGMYKRGCRCEPCKLANRSRQKRQRDHRKHSPGVTVA